jgi:2'-hydroxyisoflavone reductase
MVKLVEEKRNGIYNVTGPAEPLTFGQFIAETHAALKPDATPVWVDDYAFLRQHRIEYAIPWMIPEGDNAYHLRINNRKAVAAGLRFRPIGRDGTGHAGHLAAAPRRASAGQQPNFRWITPEKEREVLAAWKSSRK